MRWRGAGYTGDAAAAETRQTPDSGPENPIDGAPSHANTNEDTP